MKSILLIGNSEYKNKSQGGQAIKVRQYYDIIFKYNKNSIFVNLEGFKKNPLKKLLEIKRGIQKCDRIVLITASRGAKLLIPFINKYNKWNKPFILPLIGISFLHWYLDGKSDESQSQFFNGNFSNFKEPKRKDIKNLSKISAIVAENEIVGNGIRNFFSINNVFIINNFRDNETVNYTKKSDDSLKLVFVSRVCEEKGIFDAIDAVKKCAEEGIKLNFSIYGEKSLNKKNLAKFENSLFGNIVYKGKVVNNTIINVLKCADILLFPTRFCNEGTPGIISEALISGTPIISSDYNQVSAVLENNKNSLIYKRGNVEELKNCIKKLYLNRELLSKIRSECLKDGEKYTFGYWKKDFFSIILGESK